MKVQLDLSSEEKGPGNPWTKDAIKCRLQRIKEELGMERHCVFGIRHSYATEGPQEQRRPAVTEYLYGPTLMSR